MAAYLDVDGLKALSVLPDERFDELATRYPSFLPAKLEEHTAWMDGLLRKRYDAPFAAPYPVLAKSWLAKLVTIEAMQKLGVDPDDEQAAQIAKAADDAKAEITKAADSVEGLWDLPLRADTTESGIEKGGPLGYSEQSPHVWKDVQASVARNENRNGRGSDV